MPRQALRSAENTHNGHAVTGGGSLSPRRDFELGADVVGYLGGVVVYEVTETVMRDAAELGPLAEGADRRLVASRENAAGAKTDDVGELGGLAGRRNGGRIHAPGAVSTGAASGNENARAGLGAGIVPKEDQLAIASGAACGGKASGAAESTGTAAGMMLKNFSASAAVFKSR